MEFLAIVLFLASLGVMVFRPQRETLSFGLFWAATGICFVMYLIASINCVLPNMAY